MERDEKRMAGGYEITHAIHIGNTEIVMGENPKAPEDERYMVADYKEKGILAQYVNCCASDDFVELAEVFAERLTEQIRQIKKQRDKTLCGKKPIDRNEGALLPLADDIKGKVIVINADCLRPEYRSPINQLYLANSGNGTSMNARGTAVYCTNLYDKSDTRMERYDILGIMEPENLPEWAKKGLDEIQTKRAQAENNKKKKKTEVER